MDLPPAELLAPERAAVLLEELGFGRLPAEVVAQAVALVPTARPAVGRWTAGWNVGGEELYAWDARAPMSRHNLYCSCSERVSCPHVAALMLARSWAEPQWQKLWRSPLWALALSPLVDPFARAAPEPSHAGWVRWHVLPPTATGALVVSAEVVRLARAGEKELKPTRYPRALHALREKIPVSVEEAELHELYWDLEQTRRETGRRTSDSAGVRLERNLLRRLIEALSRHRDVRYQGAGISVSTEPLLPRLHAEPDDAGGLALCWVPPLAVVWTEGFALAGGVLHPLSDALPEKARARLHRPLPRVPPSDVDDFASGFATALPVPVDLPAGVGGLKEPGARSARLVLSEDGATLVVSLGLAYALGGETAEATERGPTVRVGRWLVRRDPAWEEAERRRFDAEVGELRLEGDAALDFLAERLPELRERWEVFGEDGLVRLRVRGRVAPHVAFRSGQDWFDLDVSFRIGESSVAVAEVLRSWLEGRRYVKLADGALAKLPEQWLARHGPAVDELVDLKRITGRLGAHQAWVASELLAEAGPAARPWVEVARSLGDFAGVPKRPLPEGFTGALRDYQQRGYEWMAFLRDRGLAGVLADDMGLGKTVQALVLLADTHREAGASSLVVAPTSVLHNWAAEAARFVPGLRVAVHRSSRDALPAADVVVVSYAMMRLDPAIAERAWRYVILDEAQNIKNPASQVAQAARALRSEHRLALTGTPLENHLVELWSLFAFLMPGFFGSRKAFHARYAGPAQKVGEAAAALGRLRERLRPFVLRRLKREVARELPPRQDVVLRVELSAPERELYDRVRETYRASVLKQVAELGVRRATLHVLEALTRMRQACCHPALLPFPEARAVERSSKIEVLCETLEDAIEDGHKALVFSQWPSLLRKVAEALDARGWGWELLEGATTDRERVVARFSAADGPPVFLVSIKAGGSGLNLVAADHVFHLDPWWNPQVEEQATDRAHRIGQDRPVMVYKLVAQGTVEEKILELQARKRALFEAAIETDRLVVDALTREDLEAVFGDDG